MTTETRNVINALERAVEQVMVRLSVNTTAELIERTPTDTGWARANWVPAIGTAFEGNAEDLSEEARRAAVPGQAAQQQSSTAALLGYRLEEGTVFIANNVPYIVFLNEGSSQQAPAGFVQDAIAAGIMSLAGINLT